MAKRKPETMESLPEWDCSTYQTGSTTPPRRTSGFWTVLLALAIFLGGLVSGLGMLNVRQIRQLTNNPSPTIHVSQGDFTLPVEESMFSNNNTPAPTVPNTRSVQLQMVESPYYANNVDQLAMESPESIYNANRHSLVEVYALSHSNTTQSAVGVVLSQDGYILANAHLVEAAKRVFVYLSDGRLLPAAVVGSDNMTDLAVLYVQAHDLVPAVFGTSGTLQAADPIFTISLQDDVQLPMVMFEGSMFTATRDFSTEYYNLGLLQTCHHSESGPLFNSFGQVVGLCVSRTAQYFNESDSLGLVLGSNSMQHIIDQLLEKGHVSGRPDLGFSVEAISKLFQHYWDLPGGLLVSGVFEGSMPAQQGLQNGDIILALDGESLKTRDDLYAVLYSCSIGQQIMAVIFRDGEMKSVTLTVTELGI